MKPDRALILISQHQVIEQLVSAAVGLVGFQGGEQAAHVFSPSVKNRSRRRMVDERFCNWRENENQRGNCSSNYYSFLTDFPFSWLFSISGYIGAIFFWYRLNSVTSPNRSSK